MEVTVMVEVAVMVTGGLVEVTAGLVVVTILVVVTAG